MMNSSLFNPLGPAHYRADQAEQKIPGQGQRRIAVFFATREGHTQQIAARIAADLRMIGFDVDVISVQRAIPFCLKNYCAAVLAASVHAGNHEKEMIQFVNKHRLELNGMTTAFLSVTLSEAGAERQNTTAEEHVRFVRDVDGMLDKFFKQTKWRPTIAKPVAGALMYTQYNFLVRFVMKGIAKKENAATDTSRDYDYTDWVGLDKFADELATEVRRVSEIQAAPKDSCTTIPS
jgi:menaquinone-dependent protoporphyrinogen oxidase